jgi:hypothetical protein
VILYLLNRVSYIIIVVNVFITIPQHIGILRSRSILRKLHASNATGIRDEPARNNVARYIAGGSAREDLRAKNFRAKFENIIIGSNLINTS